MVRYCRTLLFPTPQAGSLALNQGAEIYHLLSKDPGHQVSAPNPTPKCLCFRPYFPPTGYSPVSWYTPKRRGPSLTFERPFGAPRFVRTVHIPRLEAPRRRLPLHPCQLPGQRPWRWRTILQPSSSVRSPEPSPPAVSEPPRRPGGLVRAAKAGRLDPGPLQPRPCPRPRPPPRSRIVLRPSPALASWPRKRRGYSTPPAVRSHCSQPETPRLGPPSPGWATALPSPPPPQEVSVPGQFPPLACAAASLGAAGGGNSLALTLDWLARALGWGRPDAPEAEGRTTAVCVPTSRVSAWSGTYLQTSRTVCRATECGQGRGD